MSNKTIGIVDLSNFDSQCLETLLFASILEKKYDACAIFDLNVYNTPKALSEVKKWSKGGEISKAKIFDNSLYHRMNKVPENENKALNYVQSLQDEYPILLINSCVVRYNINSKFFELCDEIVLFADFEQDLSKNILSFFLKQPVRNKKIHLVFYRFDESIQGAKKHLSMLKSFANSNIEIHRIVSAPKDQTLKELAEMEPWADIYKFINSNF